MNLSNINAEVEGSEGTLQIKSFKATAASGPVGMTGSVGVLQPGIPVDLKITASKAQPMAGSIVTANLDADLSISGKARERIDLAGKIRVNRATSEYRTRCRPMSPCSTCAGAVSALHRRRGSWSSRSMCRSTPRARCSCRAAGSMPN